MNRWGGNSTPLHQQLSVFIAGVLIGAALSQAQWSVLFWSINILPVCWVSAKPFITHPDWRWSHAGANRTQRLQTFLVTHEVTHWGETERRDQWARHQHWQVQFSNTTADPQLASSVDLQTCTQMTKAERFHLNVWLSDVNIHLSVSHKLLQSACDLNDIIFTSRWRLGHIRLIEIYNSNSLWEDWKLNAQINQEEFTLNNVC